MLRRLALLGVQFAFVLSLTGLLAPDRSIAQSAALQHVDPKEPSAPYTGSFSHAIPIEVPGYRGLEPDLELIYDSSRGPQVNSRDQGWLGYGWRLGGFSMIERCTEAPSCRPQTITYNGTEIRFHWETRPDPITYAAGAGLGLITERLKTIEVRTGSLVRAYSLTYSQAANGSSLLTQVQQFGSNAALDVSGTVTWGSALPATRLAYSANTNVFGSRSSQNGLPFHVTGDFNGDGNIDFLRCGRTQQTFRGEYIEKYTYYCGDFSSRDFEMNETPQWVAGDL